MGNNIGTKCRIPEKKDVDMESDRENVEIITPDPSPDVSYWETPELQLNPKSHIMSLIDPRSPNEDISRTPILVPEEKEGKRKFNRFLQVNQTANQIANGGGSEFTTPTGNSTLLAMDPRSPTHEIQRTPIGKGAK